MIRAQCARVHFARSDDDDSLMAHISLCRHQQRAKQHERKNWGRQIKCLTQFWTHEFYAFLSTCGFFLYFLLLSLSLSLIPSPNHMCFSSTPRRLLHLLYHYIKKMCIFVLFNSPDPAWITMFLAPSSAHPSAVIRHPSEYCSQAFWVFPDWEHCGRAH